MQIIIQSDYRDKIPGVLCFVSEFFPNKFYVAVFLCSIMASDVLQEKENFTRLSRLLVDKGTEALRNIFDVIHPPANLQAVLNGARKSLLKLKFKVINDSQWNLLFPPSGNPPDSKTFDVTLLTILLWNICSFTPPTTGWNVMPANTDRSNEANIVRLKLFRNKVYAHVTITQVNNATFESLWKEISQALVELNIPRKDVDDLKTSPLGTYEEMYLKIIKEWKSQEEDSVSKLEEVKCSVDRLERITENKYDEIKKICLSNQTASEATYECLINHKSQHFKNANLQPVSSQERDEDLLRKLAKHNFKGKIKGKLEFFHPGTREWLLRRVDQFVEDKESRILFLTGGPGFGKSVFAAKVCHDFKEKAKLAACHFCDFSNSNLRDPMMMLQSLASQMCENIVGFKEKLLDQLKRPHTIHNLKDAFQIYLQNPLDEMELKDPILLVIDALDESAADNKSEILDLINDYFPYLPACVKVLVTGRPEISIAKLDGVQKIHIANDNVNNQSDLKSYLEYCLPSLVGRKVQNPEKNEFHSLVAEQGIYKALTLKCEGSFLYAFYVQSELKKRDDLDKMTGEELIEFLPDGLDSIYQKYFKRLEEELKTVVPSNFDVLVILKMLAASKDELPLTFISRALGLAPVCRETKSIINKVNETVSCLLYVSDDSVTVFHKSVIDWLIAEGYSDHEYTVKISDGNKSLWLICENVLEEIRGIIFSEKQLKFTYDVIYSLCYAFHHLIACKIEGSFFWMADVAIIHAVFIVHFETGLDLLRSVFNAWAEILHTSVIMDDKLRARISWHVTEIYFLKKSLLYPRQPHQAPFSYLQSVLKRSPERYFTEKEKNFAETVLSKVPRFVESTLDEVTIMPLSIWLFPWSTLERHQVSTPIIEVAALSHDKSVAAIAQRHGVISVVDVPSLVELWQYSVDLACIPCCIFTPDDSLVLFGKLGTALSILERKPVTFFPGNKETFTWCAFSPNAKRLVTSNGSKCIKLWDVAEQSLIASLSTEYIVNWCSFTSTGLFITADSLYNLRSDFTNRDDNSDDLWFDEFDMEKAEEDAFCVWNAITLQRSDERNLTDVDVHGGKLMRSKPCRRCFRPGSKELNSSRKLENLHFDCKMPWPTGIYKGVQCIFPKDDKIISVIENIHFTTLATYDISHPCCRSYGFTITTHIEDDAWFYADEEKLMIFKVLAPMQEQSSCLARPTQVLSCSFSPDGSKLATCTSDGYINIWNVHRSQVEQRFESNPGESLFACWWSKEFLFVFDVLNSVPKLSKYPMDVSMNILFTEGKQVSLSHLEDEFVSLSEIVDFSEGLLGFACGETKEIKVLDVLRGERPQIVLLPELQARMHIVVSPGASFVFGGNDDSYYIWKRNTTSEQDAYDVFRRFVSEVGEIDWDEDDFYNEADEYESISEIKPITQIEYRFSCCFVNNSKTAIVMAYTEADIIDLDTGALERLNFEHSGVKFCLKNSGIAIAPGGSNIISFMDVDSAAVLEISHQRYLTEAGKKHMKLSPTETMLALPKRNGEMFFLPLHIPQSSVLSDIKRKAAIKYGRKGKLFGQRVGTCNYVSSPRVRKLL